MGCRPLSPLACSAQLAGSGLWPASSHPPPCSEFFGSGNSHQLKMLSLMFHSERRLPPEQAGEQDRRPLEILLPKVDDEIIRTGAMARVPAHGSPERAGSGPPDQPVRAPEPGPHRATRLRWIDA
jgi:hypothetical protein